MKTLMIMMIAMLVTGGMNMAPAEVAGTGAAAAAKKLETAPFAGGCFWYMEPPFDKLKGLTEVISGYTGGHTEHPKYEEVSSGRTGHDGAYVIHLSEGGEYFLGARNTLGGPAERGDLLGKYDGNEAAKAD